MSTIEAKPELEGNGRAAPERATIAVENPATGQTIASVPDMDAAQVKELVDRARAAQPAWAALGFEGRAEVMYDLRRWLVENRDARGGHDRRGDRQDARGGQLTEIFFVCDSLGFWAKNAPKYLADEKVRTHSPLAARQEDVSCATGRTAWSA